MRNAFDLRPIVWQSTITAEAIIAAAASWAARKQVADVAVTPRAHHFHPLGKDHTLASALTSRLCPRRVVKETLGRVTIWGEADCRPSNRWSSH